MYTTAGMYDVVAIFDGDGPIVVKKSVGRDEAEYAAHVRSERYGIICYVFKYDPETECRHIVSSYFKGVKGKG